MEALVSPPAVEPLFLLLIFFYSCKYIQIYLYIDARLGRDGKVTPLTHRADTSDAHVLLSSATIVAGCPVAVVATDCHKYF